MERYYSELIQKARNGDKESSKTLLEHYQLESVLSMRKRTELDSWIFEAVGEVLKGVDNPLAFDIPKLGRKKDEDIRRKNRGMLFFYTFLTKEKKMSENSALEKVGIKYNLEVNTERALRSIKNKISQTKKIQLSVQGMKEEYILHRVNEIYTKEGVERSSDEQKEYIERERMASSPSK